MNENIGYFLATLNSVLNSLSAILLILGFRAIRRNNQNLHAKFMVSAFTVSVLFLVSYLIRFYLTGTHAYPGMGLIRNVYLSILLTHTILAAAVPVLVLITLYFAIKKKFTKHAKIARVTFPIWMYVNVTGVVIYLMLYHGSY